MEEAPDPIKARIDSEIAALQEDFDRMEAQLRKANEEYDRAWAAERKIHPDSPVPEKIERRSDRASATLANIHDRMTWIRKEIIRLSSPEELERRSNVKARLKEVRKMATEKKVTAREQGFPDVYLGPEGNFKPGLDARAKSDLIGAVLGLDNGYSLHTFTPEQAQALIEVRGWEGFVAKKRDTIAGAQARAEKAATIKAEKEAARAAKPDPKPKAKPKTRGRKVGS